MNPNPKGDDDQIHLWEVCWFVARARPPGMVCARIEAEQPDLRPRERGDGHLLDLRVALKESRLSATGYAFAECRLWSYTSRILSKR